MKISLEGKVALVTGGGRGIGKAISLALGAAGATVAVHFSQNRGGATQVVAGIGNNSKLFQADFRRSASVTGLLDQVIERYGKLDILVNNAGIAIDMPMNADWEVWQTGWEQTLQVNLVSAGILSKLAIKHFQEKGGGRIIHIASRAAFRGDVPGYMAYAASKGGMVSMSRSMARYFGKDNIQSFVVAPGFTQTEMAQQFIDEFGEDLVIKDLALNKLTQPEDIAPTVVFLASGMMDHATGCTIDINAGSYVR